jgi:hypothetical protein
MATYRTSATQTKLAITISLCTIRRPLVGGFGTEENSTLADFTGTRHSAAENDFTAHHLFSLAKTNNNKVQMTCMLLCH